MTANKAFRLLKFSNSPFKLRRLCLSPDVFVLILRIQLSLNRIYAIESTSNYGKLFNIDFSIVINRDSNRPIVKQYNQAFTYNLSYQ